MGDAASPRESVPRPEPRPLPTPECATEAREVCPHEREVVVAPLELGRREALDRIEDGGPRAGLTGYGVGNPRRDQCLEEHRRRARAADELDYSCQVLGRGLSLGTEPGDRD